jgi:hypothetical protein
MGKDIIPQDKPSKLRKQAEKNLEIRLKDPKEKADLSLEEKDRLLHVLQVVLNAMHSPYGTFGYLNEAGDRVVPSMTRDIWSECQVEAKDINFPHGSWGDVIWARCIKEKLCFQRALHHPRWTHSNNPGHGRAHHPSRRGHRQSHGRQ